MALNERVQYDLNDLPHEQLAPSQASRTSFTPGKANSRPDDQNWPTVFRIPTSNPNFQAKTEDVDGPMEVTRVRIIKLHRNVVSDQTIAGPTVLGPPIVTVITDPSVWSNPPEHELTPTATQEAVGVQERTSGYDWAQAI